MQGDISIIIPTFNGGRIFETCIRNLREQEKHGETEIICIDSGSSDDTVQIARKYRAEVISIKKKEFHHAGTRNIGVRKARFDKILFIVQDAIPCEQDLLSRLSFAIDEKNVAAVYTNQVPHEDASIFARFETEGISRFLGDRKIQQKLNQGENLESMDYDAAYRMAKLDNVCAMYKKKRLEEIPFPDVSFAEDLAWAVTILKQGHTITYLPDIHVRHSHDRPPFYRFSRQIVNSKFCAKILGRVREDLSFLDENDLVRIMMRFQKEAGSIPEKWFEGNGFGFPGCERLMAVIRDIIAEFPSITRWKARCSACIRKPGDNLRKRLENLLGEFQYLIGFIDRNYDITTASEMEDIIQQSAAGILGRLCGEVYASHMIRHSLTPGLRALIEPFCSGV